MALDYARRVEGASPLSRHFVLPDAGPKQQPLFGGQGLFLAGNQSLLETPPTRAGRSLLHLQKKRTLGLSGTVLGGGRALPWAQSPSGQLVVLLNSIMLGRAAPLLSGRSRL